MKRKTIVLLPLLLILAGCQREKNSGEPSLTNPPSAETSEILKPSASEELPSLTEAPTYRFSQEVDALLEESLGEFIAELPVCTGTSYSGKNEYISKYDLTATALYCYSDYDPNDLVKTYKAVLKRNDFTLQKVSEGESPWAIKRVSPNQILCVIFDSFSSTQGKGLRMTVYIRKDKQTTFPNNQVKAFVGEEIPVAPASYYTAQVQSNRGIKALIIACYDPKSSILKDYSKLLTDNGYTYTSSQQYAEKGNVGISLAYRKKEESIESGFDGDRDIFLIAVYKLTDLTAGN